ncbi:MAG: radical SAM protein [Candidatus Aenigmatarchaeota archaeon]
MKNGETKWVKLLKEGGIGYDPSCFEFFLLNKNQLIKFLRTNRVKIIKPKFENNFFEAFIDLTYKCNLKCRHCHNRYRPFELPFNSFSKILNQVFGVGVLHISFGGGEPTLRKDLIKILKYTYKRASCSITTNGTTMTEELANQLKNCVSYVSVSLDGMKKGHNLMRNADIWDRVLESIKILKENGIRVRIITVPTKLNYREIPKLAKFIKKKIKPSAWKIMRFIPENKESLEIMLSPKEERWIYRKLKKLRFGNVMDQFYRLKCPMGDGVFSIYANGDVSPCGFFPKLVVGNCLKTPLRKLLETFEVFKNFELNECIAIKYWRSFSS